MVCRPLWCAVSRITSPTVPIPSLDNGPGCDGYQADCDGCAAQSTCGFCHGSYVDSKGVEQRWSACYSLEGADGGEALCEEEAGLFALNKASCPVVEVCDKSLCEVTSCPSGYVLREAQGACCPTCEELTTTPQPAVDCTVHDNDCGACMDEDGCGFCYGQWLDQGGSLHTLSHCWPLAATGQFEDGGEALCEEEAGDWMTAKGACPAGPTSVSTSTSTSTTSTSTAAPHTSTSTTASTGYDCNGDSACGKCDSGNMCTRCKNSLYLHEGRCVERCPATLVEWGEKAAGRECRTPFTCTAADGCECPIGGCDNCRVETGSVSCLKCRSDRFAVGNSCRKEITCKGSKVSRQRDTAGRHCQGR